MEKYSKRMMILIIGLTVVCVVGGIIYFRSIEIIPFTIGVVLGAALNLFKILIIKYVVKKSTDPEKPMSALSIYGFNLLRFLFTALLLGAAAFFNLISLVGAVIGILTMPVSGYSLSIFGGKAKFEEEQFELIQNIEEGGDDN